MYTTQPKKLSTLNILDILRKYTDAEHRLTQKEIADILESEYEMKVDRKTIKRNLDNLIDFGYELEYSSTERTLPNGETETMATDWFIRREFEDSELRLLIDSLLFSHQIPTKQARSLIEKLKGLSSVHFKTRVKHVQSLPEVKSSNKQLFYTIEALDEALTTKRKVSLLYGNYDTDCKLHPRLDAKGKPKRYVVDPYQMVATNGRYYLIGHMAHREGLTNLRIDRMLDLEVLVDEPLLPHSKLPGQKEALDLPKHMAEHIYMFAGESCKVRFKVARSSLNHVFDWFGSGATFENETAESCEVVVRVNEQAMLYWSLQFSEHVEVLEPESLRAKLREAGEALVRKYS